MPPRVQTLAFVALSCVASHAHADVDAARERFAAGVARFQTGDFDGARRLFLEADREHHSPVIDYNLALTEERLGHPQAAVDAYQRYLAQAGEGGEFASAAALAIAQITARSGRLRIDSTPSGGRVFINGLAARDRTPLLVLVPSGHHLVVIEGDDYRVSADVDVSAGQTKPVSLARPESASGSNAGPGSANVVDVRSPADLEGVVWGGSFQIVPYGFFPRASKAGVTEDGASGIFVGVSAEIGFAFTPRAVVGLRAFGSVGSECRGVFDSHIAAAGPMLGFRVHEQLWVGLGLYGGNGETCRTEDPSPPKKYSTDMVFSPLLDLSYAVTSRHYGQWLVSAGVGFFFATPSNDNRLVYAPFSFGPRFF